MLGVGCESETANLLEFELWVAPRPIRSEDDPLRADPVDCTHDRVWVGHCRSLEEQILVFGSSIDRIIDVQIATHVPEHNRATRRKSRSEREHLRCGVRIVAAVEERRETKLSRLAQDIDRRGLRWMRECG